MECCIFNTFAYWDVLNVMQAVQEAVIVQWTSLNRTLKSTASLQLVLLQQLPVMTVEDLGMKPLLLAGHKMQTPDTRQWYVHLLSREYLVLNPCGFLAKVRLFWSDPRMHGSGSRFTVSWHARTGMSPFLLALSTPAVRHTCALRHCVHGVAHSERHHSASKGAQRW